MLLLRLFQNVLVPSLLRLFYRRPETHVDPDEAGMDPAMYALVFGILSGVSLPIGAAMGVWASPVSDKTCAMMMAFGAGALLFAVTVELYAHALHEIHLGNLGLMEMFTTIFGALGGATFYLWVNRWLEEHLMHDDDDNDSLTEDGGESAPIISALRKQSTMLSKSSDSGWSRQLTSQSCDSNVDVKSVMSQPELKKVRGREKALRATMMPSASETSPPPPQLAASFGSIDSTPAMDQSIPSTPPKSKGISFGSHTSIPASPGREPRTREIEFRPEDSIQIIESSSQPGIERSPSTIKAAQKAKSVALALFMGLLIDGVPEGMLMGILSAEGHLTPVMIISLFIANFPEAFSSASLLIQADVPTHRIIGMWTGLCILVGCLAGLSCWTLLYFYPEFAHGGVASAALPMSVLLIIALIEGVTGGAMIACISAVALPEAFARAGKEGDFYQQSGFLCTAGFLLSVGLKALWG